jgi:hypothetical protein
MVRTDRDSVRRFATAAAVAVAVAVAPSQALAAAGSTTLALNGPVAQSLRDNGVRIAALKPASGQGQRVKLPVRSGLAGATTTLLSHGGGITMESSRGETLRLTKLRLLLGKRSRITAGLGSESIDLFRISGGKRKVDPDAGSVDLKGLRLKLTGAATRAITKRLDLPQDRQGRPNGRRRPAGKEAQDFGTLSSRVTGLIASGAGPGTQHAGQKEQSGCPLPSGAGPAPQEPLPVAARPPGATDIAGATIDWHVRESFIRYIATGEGTSVSGGATAGPPVLLSGASVPLSYDFRFPFASGWHDNGANPADPADDTAAIYGGGALRFLYSGHGIDLTTASPEIEINGGASRAIFTVTEGSGSPQRQVLVNLDLSRAGAIAVTGNTHTYERVPGAIPAGTATSVFGGFYAPGTEFGCFTLSYSTTS